VGLAKPEPAIFRLTLNRLGLLPHAVLFVDDLARNTRAAEALCIPAVVFTTASALREVLSSRGILD
jgi:HAD superfamily hydrolase (TIGR01509 family)